MDTNFCERGHQVWWADLNGERTAFVEWIGAYHLDLAQETGARSRVAASVLRGCYRLHRDICPSMSFRPTKAKLRQAKREELAQRGQRPKRPRYVRLGSRDRDSN